ncbi:hypothetical protein TNCV_1310651 [Trichonephila clavipes]|nr:hypothetical protein TNCV_1310651 [Trichonephila clavipes]
MKTGTAGKKDFSSSTSSERSGERKAFRMVKEIGMVTEHQIRANLVTNLYGTFLLILLGVFLGIINSRIFPINSEKRTGYAKKIGYLSRAL